MRIAPSPNKSHLSCVLWLVLAFTVGAIVGGTVTANVMQAKLPMAKLSPAKPLGG